MADYISRHTGEAIDAGIDLANKLKTDVAKNTTDITNANAAIATNMDNIQKNADDIEEAKNFVIRLMQTGSSYKSNKKGQEVKDAILAGKSIVIIKQGLINNVIPAKVFMMESTGTPVIQIMPVNTNGNSICENFRFDSLTASTVTKMPDALVKGLPVTDGATGDFLSWDGKPVWKQSDSKLSDTSTNPVQNKVVTSAISQLTNEKSNKPKLVKAWTAVEYIGERFVYITENDGGSPLFFENANIQIEFPSKIPVSGRPLESILLKEDHASKAGDLFYISDPGDGLIENVTVDKTGDTAVSLYNGKLFYQGNIGQQSGVKWYRLLTKMTEPRFGGIMFLSRGGIPAGTTIKIFSW